MGDMAEYYCQQGLDNYALGDEDWNDTEGGGYGPQPKTCRRCHERNLWWSCHDGRYRLIDAAGKLHICPVPAAKEVFKWSLIDPRSSYLSAIS
jgi:hypothetical protein